MASPGLHQNLSQSQTLAPQIRQSLEILQAGTMDLQHLVQSAIEVNPVLEDVSESLSLQEMDEGNEDREKVDTSQEHFEELREIAILENRSTGGSYEDQERREYLMNSLVGQQTLQQSLLEQLEVSMADERQRDVVRILIGDVDDRGYLETPLSETAARFSIPLEEIEDARDRLQTFRPAGVGARDLRECLMIQLEQMLMHDSIEYEIVRLHLTALAKKQFTQITKSLRLTEEEIMNAAQRIAKLDPSPGSSFDGTNNPVVIPDIRFAKDESDEWHAELTNEYLPKVRISDAYKLLLSEGKEKGVRSYLKEQIREGRNLIKALDQRQETILAITEEIILKQTDFLEKGISHLHPLTMNEIADKIGIHATTVSRAVHSKYVETPHGVLELRRFFASGYTKVSGETVSNTGVRERIQQIIEDEDKKKPLSDSSIEKILKEEGLKVARRTIAKYREQLHILPSNLRKGF